MHDFCFLNYDYFHIFYSVNRLAFIAKMMTESGNRDTCKIPTSDTCSILPADGNFRNLHKVC